MEALAVEAQAAIAAEATEPPVESTKNDTEEVDGEIQNQHAEFMDDVATDEVAPHCLLGTLMRKIQFIVG